MRSLKRCLCWLVAACWFAPPARAGNDDEVFVGNRAAMVGGAVAAAVRDGSAAWYNPAGLGGLSHDQLDTSATVYSLRIYSAPGYLSSSTGEREDASVLEFFSLPSQVAYERRLGPALGLGLAYFSPKSSNLLLREQLSIGDADNGSRWQFTLTQAEVQHRFVLALGWQLTRALRLGASLIVGYDLGTTSSSLFGSVQSDSGVTRLVTSSQLGTYADASLEIGFGAQLEVTPELSLAVFGRTPSLLLRRAIDAHFSSADAVTQADESVSLTALADAVSERHGLALLRAGRAGLGLSYRVAARTFVSAEADVQPGLSNQALSISRDPVYNLRLGAHHQVYGKLALGVGLFSDRSPTRLRSDDISAAGDFYGATLGVELGEPHYLQPTERAASLVFSSVIALRYAHSFADATRIVVDPTLQAPFPFQLAVGDMDIHELSLFLGTGFDF